MACDKENISYDLGTPRQYTQFGGWNISCECGYPLGDGGNLEDHEEKVKKHYGENDENV